jgi:hypothetical protein
MWAAVSPLKFVEQIDPNPSLVTDETYDGSGLPAIRIGQHNIGGPTEHWRTRIGPATVG